MPNALALLELDDALGLTNGANGCLQESRTVLNAATGATVNRPGSGFTCLNSARMPTFLSATYLNHAKPTLPPAAAAAAKRRT